jgi:uncharacterized protein (TIGR02145 family)
MKHILLGLMLFITITTNAQVGIGTVIPNTSAVLDITSTNKGFLPPRMTAVQRDLISAPAQGLVVYCTNCGTNGELQVYNGTTWTNIVGGAAAAVPPSYPTGSVFCASGASAVVNVTSTATGKIWMDRNLGASQVATSSTDANSYGDLYQWGRRSDGHQCRTSPTTSTLSSTDQPANGSFILVSSSLQLIDWRSPQNHGLWQGVNGVNNPCPSGYRLPTEVELDAERSSWSSNNSAGAFASPLKLPMAGARQSTNGSLDNVGTYGFYWSSTVGSVSLSRWLGFGSNAGSMNSNNRALGFSVRCIKN